MLRVFKIQAEAIKLLCDIGSLSIENMKHWLSKQGYTLHYFSESEAESLGIDKTEKGFKRKSELLKIVYIKESLSYKEKLETIIHECGHVIFDDDSILKSNGYREMQANLFTEFVSAPTKAMVLICKLLKSNSIYKFIIAVLLLILAYS